MFNSAEQYKCKRCGTVTAPIPTEFAPPECPQCKGLEGRDGWERVASWRPCKNCSTSVRHDTEVCPKCREHNPLNAYVSAGEEPTFWRIIKFSSISCAVLMGLYMYSDRREFESFIMGIMMGGFFGLPIGCVIYYLWRLSLKMFR